VTGRPTPSQTVGPFFAVGLCWPDGPYVVPDGTPGAFRLSGRLLDGAGDPVPDALVETWQADPAGRFGSGGSGGRPGRSAGGSGFRGFGRCPTDAEGRFWVLTVKPGRVPHPGGGLQAPHLDLAVFARGLLRQAVTRVYFGDEPDANAADPVLADLPEAARATLLAVPVDGGYHLDLHLQGEHATVFFAF
jgi:protocatechuate 3,4-dioxygenase, alpha subunit